MTLQHIDIRVRFTYVLGSGFKKWHNMPIIIIYVPILWQIICSLLDRVEIGLFPILLLYLTNRNNSQKKMCNTATWNRLCKKDLKGSC